MRYYEANDGDDEGSTDMCPCITSNRTYYVAQTGSDLNDGLTALTPFGTIEHAMDVIGGFLVPSNVTVTVQLLDGTIEVADPVIPPVMDGHLQIIGNTTTPGNVIVSLDGTSLGFSLSRGQRLLIDGFMIDSVAAGATPISVTGQARLVMSRIILDDNFVNMVVIREGGIVMVTNALTISGNCTRFLSLQGQGEFNMVNVPVTLTGTPAFSAQFALVSAGYARFDGCTFSGSATGTRYLVNQSGVLFTNGSGASFLPGNSAGSVATQGQYL